MIDTRESLLDRLREEDAHEAWREFYHLYWGAILRYARKLGLNQSQAEDVLQETMVSLMRIIPGFVYDRQKGRFRNFLLSIVHRKSLAALRRARRDVISHGESLEMMPTIGDDHADDEKLTRWRETLAEEALRQLRSDANLDAKTFAVFEAYAIQQRPVLEVAAEFGLKENAVYQIKNRMMRRMRANLNLLLRASGTDAPNGPEGHLSS